MVSNPGGCQAKTGFVILHKCDAPADAQCQSCGKYICRKHTHIHGSQPLCEGCFKTAAPDEYNKSVGARSRYGHYYGYVPYYYPHYASDRSHLFDRGSDSFHEDSGGS